MWSAEGPRAARGSAGRPDVGPTIYLEELRSGWGTLWVETQPANDFDWSFHLKQELATLPRLPALEWSQLKDASSRFSKRTARGVDGLHVTAYQHLCEEGLRAWALL